MNPITPLAGQGPVVPVITLKDGRLFTSRTAATPDAVVHQLADRFGDEIIDQIERTGIVRLKARRTL